MKRRQFTLGLVGAALAGKAGAGSGPQAGAGRRARARLAGIEREHGGRFGAWVLDTATGREFGWRGDERFGLCSTFKLFLAARVLEAIDNGTIGATDVLRFGAADLLPGSPVTARHAGEGGMTVLALAEAAQTTSDNLAANLLLRRIGGPAELTRFWRRLGAPGCRLDRVEPDLNFQPPGELRDTATPREIAHAAAAVLGPHVLKRESRAVLLAWMAQTTTGMARIRAGLPAAWRAGDKTGTGFRQGMANLTNDIAVAWPTGAAAPMVVVGFRQAPEFAPAVRAEDEAALKALGEEAVQWLLAAG